MKTDIQKIVSAFSAVAGTTYGPDYSHPPESHAFFDAALNAALSRLPPAVPIRILEIGCGNGYWLRSVAQTVAAMGLTADLSGTDVTPAQIDAAREALKDLLPASALSVADILKDDPSERYHLCYVYDLVQQIASDDHPLLFSRTRSLLERDGLFVILDRDPRSRYGLAMNLRKFLTRRLGLRLVPEFYLLARYPSFRRLARLARRAGFEVIGDLRGASRRALVLRET